MKVEPIKEHIGAIIEVERSRLGDPEVAHSVNAALERHGVLVFPKIGVTDEEQLRFTDSLGKRMDFSSKVDGGKGGTPSVYRISLDEKINRQKEYIYSTYFWHMDGLTVPEQPPKASILSGRRLSAKGGDTHFCNTYAAYQSLSDELKEEIENLQAVHDLASYLNSIVANPSEEERGRWNGNPVNHYPLVWTHGDGRKSLVLGATAQSVSGMSLAEGKALLARLTESATRPEYIYEHKWQEGDLVIWDNYGTLHRVTPYPENSGRKLHRTSVEGCEILA